MLPDNTCWFLAADFDGDDWQRDALAYEETCRILNVPCTIERSRSGNGAHLWIFFQTPVPAALARRLGSLIVTETMERLPDIGFRSYDRFFPSQDSIPTGGFGNLIALPLQGAARQKGNSVFVGRDLESYPDQRAYLGGLQRMLREDVERIIERASAAGPVLAVRLPLEDEDEEPWLQPPSRRKEIPHGSEIRPASIRLVLADQVYVPRGGLPPWLVARLLRSRTRNSIPLKRPRIICCAELTLRHVALPRGCFDAVRALFEDVGIEIDVLDERNSGRPIEANFIGVLRDTQERACDILRQHDSGVLAATTAFGKTVVAARMIAEQKTNTLILLHRRLLMD